MPDNRDIAIRVSGLLQAIINSGTPKDEWETNLKYALVLHSNICKALLSNKEKPKNG